MGSIASNYNTSVVSTLFHGVVSMITGFYRNTRDYLATARAERELRLLDDRMLADIGLSRSEITYAVHNGRDW